MTDTSYYLENGSDLIVVNGNRGTYADVSLSDTITFEFFVKEPIDNNRTSNKTVYDTPSTVYNRLKEYEDFAGYFTTNQTLEDTSFTETKDFSSDDVSGLVISVQPGDDVEQARGVWGLINSFDDSTEIFGAVAVLSLEIYVLGEFDDYADETALRDALEADI
jgi:hypothetical protein